MAYTNTRIPKIIHQTWKTENIPDEWKECVQSWKKYHPDWEYRLWTDEKNREFIKENYPDFLEIFDAYTYNIQRADAIRYCILYKYGGLYVDMDFECLQSIDSLVSERTFVIGYEPKKQAHWHGEDRLISNAFMASIPGHNFLLEIIKTMKRLNPQVITHREVLEITGPIMINNVLKKYTKGDIVILQANVLYPYTSVSEELDKLINKKGDYLSLKEQSKENGAFAIHYWANTWVRNLTGPLINPNPWEVEGYGFYQGLDSIGYDIANVGRDIEILANECNKNKKAVGFNTDGFLKYYVKPRVLWVKEKRMCENEGLYIKKGGIPRLLTFKNHLKELLSHIRQKLG